MSEPRSIRLDAGTAVTLSSFVVRHPGWSQAGAIARLLDEALRKDAHPAIVFRDGPTGRRAGIIAGPDVWEIIRASAIPVRQSRT